MKKVLRAYKKTVSIVNETAIWMYENLGSDRIGFLMESNEKESGKYTFMGVDPQALVQSQKDGLVITENNGNVTKLKGNPLVLLKEYFSSFEVHSDDTENLPDDNEDEIGIETIQLMLALKFIAIDHMAETVTAVVLDEDNEEGKKRALAEAEKLIDEARTPGNENKKSCEIKNHHDGVIIKKSDTLEQYSEKVNKIKEYIYMYIKDIPYSKLEYHKDSANCSIFYISINKIITKWLINNICYYIHINRTKNAHLRIYK